MVDTVAQSAAIAINASLSAAVALGEKVATISPIINSSSSSIGFPYAAAFVRD